MTHRAAFRTIREQIARGVSPVEAIGWLPNWHASAPSFEAAQRLAARAASLFVQVTR